MSRKPLSKRLRFEIFKRDGFRCRYCGSTPTSCRLCIDHIIPVAKGGEDTPMNLVTACYTCNQGKSDVALGDGQVQHADPDAIREQAEQLRAYTAACDALADARDDLRQMLCNALCEATGRESAPVRMISRLALLTEQHGYGFVTQALAALTAAGETDDPYRYFNGIVRRMLEDRDGPLSMAQDGLPHSPANSGPEPPGKGPDVAGD